MNTNEIPGWLDQHGGADGPPQTDANGVTTHRAKDGSYVTVYAGQVRMIGHGAQATADQQAPAQPAQRAGGGMGQQELEARIAELQRQYPGLKFMGRSVKEKNRSRVDEETGRTVTETVSVPVVQWIDPSTGYTLTAEVGAGGGSYTVTDDRIIDTNIAKPNAGGGSAQPPETKDEGGRRWVWKPNSGGPNAGGRWEDVGSAPETPAERQAREANAPTQSVRVEEVNGTKYTVITIVPKPGQPGQPGQIVLGPDGKALAGGIPGKQPVEDKKVVTGPDGKTYIRVTVQKPDGSVDVYHTDQGGNRATFPDDTSKQPIPGNAPVFTPSQGEADLGLQAFARSVRQRTDLTKEQQDQLIREAHQTATTVISRQTSTINTQENTRQAEITQRGQDAQLAAQRLSAANSVYGNALTKAGEDTKYSTGADAMAVAPYYTMLGLGAARMFGGMETPARVQNGPAIQAVQQQGLPTVAGLLAQPATAPVAPGADPAMAEAIRQQTAATTQATTSAITPLLAPKPPTSPAPPVPPATPAPVAPPPASIVPNGTPNPGPVPGQDASEWQPPIEPAPPTLGSAPAPEPSQMPPPPPMGEAGQAVAEVGTVVVRNRLTGEKRVLTRTQWEQEKANQSILGRLDSLVWEEVAGAAPDTSIPPMQGPMTEEAPPAPPAPPSGGAFPPVPIVPRAGTEAGGNVQMAPTQQPGSVAAMLGGGTPAQQGTPGALGTQLMAAGGDYDPGDVNQAWLDAGMDPQIVAMFGGGRRVA